MENIVCERCKKEKNITEFKKNKKKKVCNKCIKERLLLIKENKNLLIINKRKCNNCFLIKDILNFRSNKIYINHECNDCEKEKRKIYCSIPEKKEKIKYKARQYRESKKEKLKIYEYKFRKFYHQTLKGYASRLYSNALRRANLKNLEFDLTSEWVFEKLKNLTCEATNFKLILEDKNQGRINPLKPSLDKIDNNKGYTKDNTRLVCWWYNVMKQDWSDEIINNLIIKYYDNKTNNNK